jgi:hypothetical protein
MDKALGQAGFRIGIFVLFTSGILLLILDRDSAEYVLMLATFGCASVFLLGIALLVHFLSRR